MSPEQQGPCWPPLGCPAAPNGKKARHFPPQGHTRGFVRELRDARLGWWGGEAGESHSRHETCVFLRRTVQNSNSNCRPQPRGVLSHPRAEGGGAGRHQVPGQGGKRASCGSKADQHKGAFVNAAACPPNPAQNHAWPFFGLDRQFPQRLSDEKPNRRWRCWLMRYGHVRV